MSICINNRCSVFERLLQWFAKPLKDSYQNITQDEDRAEQDHSLNSAVVRAHWEKNAALWIRYAELDLFKAEINTPAFLNHLPKTQGKYGLEIGCGTGKMAVALSKGGARILATDICENFIENCSQIHPVSKQLRFERADATRLQYRDRTFDFAISVHCM